MKVGVNSNPLLTTHRLGSSLLESFTGCSGDYFLPSCVILFRLTHLTCPPPISSFDFFLSLLPFLAGNVATLAIYFP